MARIRSIHPGQWTDEDFVSLTFPARLLAIALRNEADDQGVFEWKPVGLKMRLLPADTVDVAALLSELEGAEVIKRYALDGREYGAIRNFGRYQTPRFPKAVHPITDEIRKYISSTEVITEVDGDETSKIQRSAEIAPLMERRGEENKKEPNGSSGLAPSARAPAEPLSIAWLPQPAERRYASDLGLSEAEIDREALKFRGYWTDGNGAGKRKTPKGWRQAWQNWIAKACERLPPAPVSLTPRTQQQGSDPDREAASRRYLRALDDWKRDSAHGNPGRPEPKLVDYLPKDAVPA